MHLTIHPSVRRYGRRMRNHLHDLGGQEWPFADPQNVAAICCAHVLEGMPVLRVTHDEDDGSLRGFAASAGGYLKRWGS